MTLRQQRLSALFGNRDSLCYSVFICCTRYKVSDEEFNRAAAEHGIDPDSDGIYEFPKKSFGDKLFNPGFLMKSGDMRMARLTGVQPVFTQNGYMRVGDAIDEDRATQDLLKVARHYTDAIERQCQGISFGGDLHAQNDDYGIDFKYAIHAFDPDICHPAEVEKLKPVTVVDGYFIRPAADKNLSLPRLLR